ncbi:MAG: hypothetical protein JKY52_13345 [Flavobacteriales bacterium]|nr:hypothetical protein [Flavobacteriales bacterium]
MKKVYSLFGAIFIASVCFAQQSTTGVTNSQEAPKLRVVKAATHSATRIDKAVPKENTDNTKPTTTNTATQTPATKPEKTHGEGTKSKKQNTNN